MFTTIIFLDIYSLDSESLCIVRFRVQINYEKWGRRTDSFYADSTVNTVILIVIVSAF